MKDYLDFFEKVTASVRKIKKINFMQRTTLFNCQCIAKSMLNLFTFAIQQLILRKIVLDY